MDGWGVWNILFLFPMSMSEVAASHSSTIPMVTAASDSEGQGFDKGCKWCMTVYKTPLELNSYNPPADIFWSGMWW